MPALSMLIKPVSGNCNLRCKYCFYYDVASNRDCFSYGKMSLETLENLIKKALEYAQGSCTFAFQGGEPTLAGIEFYEKAVELQKKYNIRNIRINNSIQTNGTLLNDDWAKFLKNHNFLVGVSLDGTRKYHDEMRGDAQGNGTFTKVMEGIRLLQKYKVDFNILCVVNNFVAQGARQIYNFFAKYDFEYIQPIPCLDPLGEQTGGQSYSLSPENYSYFLKTFFDMWYEELNAGKVRVVRIFDNYLSILMGYQPEMCSMGGSCICQSVVEADGSVYPCDFYVLDEWKLGNINEKNFEQLIDGKLSHDFIEISQKMDRSCKKCEWKWLCRGGCRRSRENFQDRNTLKRNDYCQAYKEFFAYAYPRLEEIKKRLTRGMR